MTSLALGALRDVEGVERVLDCALWQATGERPQLVVADSMPSGLGGKARFELDVIAVRGCGGEPALRFDLGRGFDQSPAFALSRPAGSLAPWSAEIELPAPPRGIRVDPCAGRGRFLCSELRYAPAAPAAANAALVHLSRPELWPETAQYLSGIPSLERLYLGLPLDAPREVEQAILASYPKAVLRRLRASDAGPAACLELLDLALAQGVRLACLLHTRPSPHVQGAEVGRWDMAHKLLGSRATAEAIVAAFDANASLGIVAPAGHLLPAALAGEAAGSDAVSGTMAWARLEAIAPLRSLDARGLDDEAAEAMLERRIVESARSRGYEVAETRVPDSASRSALDFAPATLLDAAERNEVALADLARQAAPAPGITLSPLAGLEALDASAGRWRATDNDPQFLVEGLREHAGRWVLVRATLGAPFAAALPAIYFDFGAGFALAGAASLARPGEGGLTETVCCLPPAFERARLDPVSSPGAFALTGFEVRPLTVVQAIGAMRQALRAAGASEVAFALERLFPAYAAMLAPFDDSYAAWIRRYEPDVGAHAAIAKLQAGWAEAPELTLLVLARGGSVRATMDSVLAQVYPGWRMYVADDRQLGAQDREALEAACRRDARVRRIEAAGRSRASIANTVLADAGEGLFAMLEGDVLLHPLALHFAAAAARASPDCAFVFADEDRIAADGARYEPHFKCELNYELLLASDTVSRFACWRAKAARAAGGLREGFEGAEAYDLALRVVERAGVAAAAHVPRVLAHVRDAASLPAAPAAEPALRAVADHLARTGTRAEAMPAPGSPPWPQGLRRVRFALPQPAPRVAIVIPTRDRADLLRTCVDSVLERTRYPDYSLLVVDNGSREEATRALLEAYRAKGVRVLRDDSEFNFAAINNRAVASVAADFVCLLNNDTEVLDPGWLEEMVAMAARPGVGAVGARLWQRDGRLQHAGLVLGIAGVAGYAHRLLPAGAPGYFGRAIVHQAMGAATAACLVVRKSLYHQVGGFDEKLAVAFNDVDFCMRLADAGSRTVWTPYAELVHDESSTRGAESTPEKARRLAAEIAFMRARWGARLFSDPAYSPNLTLDAEDFSPAWPPRVAESP